MSGDRRKKGLNVDKLLEKVLLEAELLDLKANPDRRANGTVIESSLLDKGRGYVMTVLVQGGTLRVGDILLAGCYSGRVKALFNERGFRSKEARSFGSRAGARYDGRSASRRRVRGHGRRTRSARHRQQATPVAA